MKVDYHMHTLCSDGVYEVETVIDMAINAGISALAVTDHDTISGIARARQCCTGRVGYITGTEITCAEHSFSGLPHPASIHLLGYGFDETDSVLSNLFSSRQARVTAVYQELMNALCALGYPVTVSDIPISCGNVLQLCDVASHVSNTFSLADDRALRLIDSYTPKLTEANITIEKAITAIHHAGGKAVWAHPYHVYCHFHKSRLLRQEVSAALEELISLGIDGLETEYPAFSDTEKEYLNSLAAAHGLITTAGSDFHGSAGRNRMGMDVTQNSFLL